MKIFSQQMKLFDKHPESGLLSVEVITLIYMAVTAVMTLIWWDNINGPDVMMAWRVGVVAYIVAANLVYRRWPTRMMVLLRMTPLLLCLIQWYPETYEFCKQFNYQDHVFARTDWMLFGCQPSMLMDSWLSSTFWYEAFNLGYYSYYYMMMAVLMFYFFVRYERFQWASFVFLASFFLFYFIYEFLPVAGPQYYYCALGVEASGRAEFPALGHYFVTHTEVLPLEVRGFFSKMVLAAQETGERPTAAFPSSHVGMSTVSMLLAWYCGNRRLFWLLMPFWLLLVIATVYIKAHYAIDSICGLVAAVAFFALTSWLYPKVKTPFRLKD